MPRKPLTLSVEERLTRRATDIADEKRGTSISRLVETFSEHSEKPEAA